MRSLRMLFTGGSIYLFCCNTTSCDDKEVVERETSQDLGSEIETQRYMAMTITSAEVASSRSRSRASEDFNRGDENEWAITSDIGANIIVFFDVQDNKLGQKNLMTFSNQSSTDYLDAYKAYCAFDSENEDEMRMTEGVVNALLILNASNDIRTQISVKNSLADILNIVNTGADIFYQGSDGKIYFTMSSSMIVQEGSLTPVTKFSYDTSVDESLSKRSLKFFTSIDEAKENPSVEFYVERLQVKYEMTFGNSYYDSETQNPIILSNIDFNVYVLNAKDETVPTKNIKVHIVGWGINATEKEEYLFKKLNPEADESIYYKGWDKLNDENADPFRSYWAEDLHYSDGYYPEQFREAWDSKNTSSLSFSEASLNYFSYVDLSKKVRYHYSTENTYDPDKLSLTSSDFNDLLTTKGYLRCGTYAIVAAQLLIEEVDGEIYEKDNYSPTDLNGEGLINNVKDKFYVNGIYLTEEQYMKYYITNLGTALTGTADIPFIDGSGDFNPLNNLGTSKESGDNVFFVDVEGEKVEITSEEINLSDYLEVASANIKGGDGWCYITKKTDLYYKKEKENEDSPDEYGTISDVQYEALAYYYKEYMAKHFSEGRMYYAIPIKHNLNSPNFENVKSVSEQTVISTGDFGAVRNHWYNIAIGNVKNVGCPVDDPEQPIITSNEPTPVGIVFEVEIIPWHVIEEDVDI